MSAYALTGSLMIQRTSDDAMIPPDIANLDYADYLAWVAAGNTPVPYVAPPAPPLTATPLQFRLALANAGIRTSVETWISTASQADQDAYHYASVFVETDTLIMNAAAAMTPPISAAEIHTLFQAMQILSP